MRLSLRHPRQWMVTIVAAATAAGTYSDGGRDNGHCSLSRLADVGLMWSCGGSATQETATAGRAGQAVVALTSASQQS
jgi:hypothetical protein